MEESSEKDFSDREFVVISNCIGIALFLIHLSIIFILKDFHLGGVDLLFGTPLLIAGIFTIGLGWLLKAAEEYLEIKKYSEFLNSHNNIVSNSKPHKLDDLNHTSMWIAAFLLVFGIFLTVFYFLLY